MNGAAEKAVNEESAIRQLAREGFKSEDSGGLLIF